LQFCILHDTTCIIYLLPESCLLPFSNDYLLYVMTLYALPVSDQKEFFIKRIEFEIY